MSKREYTNRAGKTAKPVPKEARVDGMSLPESVAPPVSDSTAAALRRLIGPAAPKKLPRQGWGGR